MVPPTDPIGMRPVPGHLRKVFAVYMMATTADGVLYVGVTSDLASRIWEHRNGVVEGFTARYKVKRLVWYEQQPDAAAAILREKQIKRWRRAWKVALIEKENPEWRDLYEDIAG